jgi:hypothetical protein
MARILKRRALVFLAVVFGSTATLAALALFAYYRPVP